MLIWEGEIGFVVNGDKDVGLFVVFLWGSVGDVGF